MTYTELKNQIEKNDDADSEDYGREIHAASFGAILATLMKTPTARLHWFDFERKTLHFFYAHARAIGNGCARRGHGLPQFAVNADHPRRAARRKRRR